MTPARFRLEHSFARELPGLYVPAAPEPAPAPRLLFLNRPLAAELGLDLDGLDQPALAALFAGNSLPDNARPIAQAYAGHQFGHFVPQLGDGRALLWGEVVDVHGQRRDLAFKGSGRTPYSRGGDGKAALGPMLREAILGEAMHALGIPSTRALAVVASGAAVWRERPLPGAVLTRVAASHLRVGSFQYLAARGDLAGLARLLDHTLERHDADLHAAPDRALALLERVVQRQAALLAAWMNVGFIHGVMNTDNMALSGETIDYGPCAFMEAYDPASVFSSIDRQGRYAYGNQPAVAQWNLARFAEALLPLHGEHAEAQLPAYGEAIARFTGAYADALLQGQRRKLGLQVGRGTLATDDAALVADWLALLAAQRVDTTLAWRRLAAAAEGEEGPLRALFADADALAPWLARWHQRCAAEDAAPAGEAMAARAQRMRAVNPRVIARNHRVEEALAAASDDGDLQPFDTLLAALARPFAEDAADPRYAEPASAAFCAGYRTFCGT
jgi:serine/tyrosine/threonine adenylyltransferase